MIGFAASLKYFPLVYLFYPFSKSNKKSFIGLLIGVLLITSLPLLTGGLAVYTTFLNEFIGHANGNLSGQGQFSYTFQSIDALLANFFIYDEQMNPEALFNAPYLKMILKIGFALTVLYFATKVFRRKNTVNTPLTFGTCIVAATLILPASASYHLLLLIPALLLVFDFLKSQKNSRKELIILAFLTLVSCSILPHHIPYFESNHTINTLLHFPRLYGLIALFIYLFLLQKRYLQTDA